MFSIKIPNNVNHIMNKLAESGYKVYVVGGCVRDSLLGLEPKDWDLTTAATSEQIKEVFKDYPIINNNGEKHGTVTVRYNDENIEITTFRIDGEYTDSRHPDTIKFTNKIGEDLSRRDFTINAMAYDGKNLIDPFGGQEDLKNHIIKAVGVPCERFTEDALRILRGIRFASRYKFEIEKETLDAMYHLRYSLTRISAERIQSELNGILYYGENFGYLIAHTVCSQYLLDILRIILPEIKSFANSTIKLLENIPQYNVCLALNISRLLRGLDVVSVCEILSRLKYSNEITDLTLIFINDFNRDLSNKVNLKLFLNMLVNNGYPSAFKDDEIVTYLIYKQDKDYAPVSHKYTNYRNLALKNLLDIEYNRECFCLKDLEINGNDIIKLGFSGPAIGDILDTLLDKVIRGHLDNQKDILINYVKENFLI